MIARLGISALLVCAACATPKDDARVDSTRAESAAALAKSVDSSRATDSTRVADSLAAVRAAAPIGSHKTRADSAGRILGRDSVIGIDFKNAKKRMPTLPDTARPVPPR